MALVQAGESVVKEEEIEQTTETSVSQTRKDLGNTKIAEDSASFHGTHASKSVEETGSSSQNLECSAKDESRKSPLKETQSKNPSELPDIYKPLEPVKKFEPLKPFEPLQELETPKSFELTKQIVSSGQLETSPPEIKDSITDVNQNTILPEEQSQLSENLSSVSTFKPIRLSNSDEVCKEGNNAQSFELIKPLEIQCNVTPKQYEPLKPFDILETTNSSRTEMSSGNTNLDNNKVNVEVQPLLERNEEEDNNVFDVDNKMAPPQHIPESVQEQNALPVSDTEPSSRNSLFIEDSDQEPFELRTSTGELYVPVVALEPLNLEDYLKPIVTTNNSSAEIKEDKIKNSLKEIISDLDTYAEKDKELKESLGPQSSLPTEFKEQQLLRNQCDSPCSQDVQTLSLLNCPRTKPRPVSLPPENYFSLIKCAQIAQELNKVVKVEGEQDENQGPRPAISLEKLFTPADDAPQIQPQPARKVFASSSFYAKGLHPTMEEQVELAKRISSSLSDISNKTSKGQSMYVNRKKRSVKWVHEGEGQANATQNGDGGRDTTRSKSPLRLVMNPHGQVHDIHSLRKQGYDIESALSPEVCLEIVKDLNSPKGKGAELFAKRRKRSEKWVVGGDTNGEREKENSIPDIAPSPAPTLPPIPPLNLPTPGYLPETTQRMQHNQKLDEIQERFTRPKLKLVKSPWDAALETGSVETAFENLAPAWPSKGNYVAPVVDSYEQALRKDSLSTWRASPSNGYNPQPEKVFAHNPAYNSSSINRIVDNLQKGVSNVDVYKPKHPQAWNSKMSQQPQYSSSSLPRSMAKAPPSPSFKASTTAPPVFIPKETATPLSSYPPQPSYSSQPSYGYQDYSHLPPPPTTPKLDVNSLQNYNTAPRGWGQVKDFYKPITFDKPRSPFTDF